MPVHVLRRPFTCTCTLSHITVEHQFPLLPPWREPKGQDQHTDHVQPGPSPWQHAEGGLEEPAGLPPHSLLGQAAPRVHG